MAGKVNHRTEDRIFAEFLHWVMDGEALTTQRERETFDKIIEYADDVELETTLCMQCEQPFVQPKDARRRRVFCEGCR
jgi:hypothetical protein